MLTIKRLCDIEKFNRKDILPESLVKYLEHTFIELHEAYESETHITLFSLEMYGPIYVLEPSQDGTGSLTQIGFQLKESGLLGCYPEWVEKIDLLDHQIWRIGVMTDNDCLFQVILPLNEFGPDIESWLEELSAHDSKYP